MESYISKSYIQERIKVIPYSYREVFQKIIDDAPKVIVHGEDVYYSPNVTSNQESDPENTLS